MFTKKPKKCIFTLNLDSEVYKEITDLTYPLIKQYAYKIDSDFHQITERKFPEFSSPTYEKVQIYQLAQEMQNDWNIFIDCDALIHPDTPDFTHLISKDTVAHFGKDFAPIRWKYDRFFLRDHRHIGSGTWFCMASDWCIELFKPLDDLTPEEIYKNIFPTTGECLAGYTPDRLIEDYVFSRNIAKYGLRFITIDEILRQYQFYPPDFMFHDYAKPIEQKIVLLQQCLRNWRLI